MSSDDSSDHEADNENPEFFDPSQHKFKKQSKEKAWLGDFGDYEEESTSYNKKKRNYTDKLNFVPSSSNVKDTAEASDESEGEAQPRNMEEEEDYDDATSFRGFQQAAPAVDSEVTTKSRPISKAQGFSFTPIIKKPPIKHQPVKPLPKDYASFLNNPQGNKIMKMMEKMGFQEGRGLGPDGKGRVEPIQVQLRGKQSGIGFGSKEKPEVKSASESEDEDLGLGQLPKKPNRSKIQYQSLDEAMARVEQAMPKELGTVSEMSGSSALTEDVRLVVDLSRESLLHLEQNMKTMNLQRQQAIQEQESLQPLLDRATQEQSLLKSLVELCTRLELVSLDQNIDFVALRPHLTILEEQRRQVQGNPLFSFINSRLQEMAVSLVSPQFARLLDAWDIEAEPILMVDFFAEWASLFVPTREADYDAYEETRNMLPFDALLYSMWYPKVKAFIENDWDPSISDAALTLMQGWAPLLPSFLMHSLIEQYVVPKLLASLEAWDPHKTPISFHFCFHPWLPILVDGLDALRPTIRAKLSAIVRDLDHFPPEVDLFADYIKPWLPILSEKDRIKLIDRTAFAKLQYVLSSRLIIDPSKQVLDHFSRAMYWSAAMPPQQFGELLSTSFFPNFMQVLAHWLTLNPPITDVMQWYTFWKSLLPQEVANTPQVEKCLRSFLVQVNSHMDASEAAG
ncbi:hypothetical protein DSO57_1027098 [Entomophthora muscae]|uniref:Uncharacterized protein n=1 Tax=Entomophthora muscae TaxID=34485 RepID=A0ACC2SR14_9FUNG|nr:hypothetical protein DSO57_1027098 [Entomophthora muscae]